jgi:hypothetical protein
MVERWSDALILARPRLHHSNPPLLRRCSCGREVDIVDIGLELDMTSGEIEIPEDLAVARCAVRVPPQRSGRQHGRVIARLLVRRELIDRAVVSSPTVDRCTVEVTCSISHHPVVSGGPVWRALKAMDHTLGPYPVGAWS